MISRLPLFVALSLCAVGVRSPDETEVRLRFEKKLPHEGHGFVPLFEYDGTAHVMYAGDALEIVPPALGEAAGDVAYGFVYFTGQPDGKLENNILFLVAGYTGSEPRFFVDLNNNLDLTDDEPAVGREGEGDGRDVLMTLRAADGPEFTFTVRLGFFRDNAQVGPDQLAEFETLLGGVVRRHGGKATRAAHWMAERRLNARSASIRVGERAFQVGLHDWNCNGRYDDVGVDMVLVGEFDGEYLSRSKSGGANVIGDETLVRVQGQVFEITAIDPAGRSLRIAPSDKEFARLAAGSRLPDIGVRMLLDDFELPLDALAEPGTFLLIDFWGHWCKGCIVAIPTLKRAAEEFAGELTILGLHSGDHDEARDLIDADGLDWLHGIASDELVEAFLVDSWPTYVLVDADGRILSMSTSVNAALDTIRAAR